MDAKALSELKNGRSTRSLHPLVLQRWSPYGFATDAVSNEDLAALFEAASWAASSFNEQPWRYIVATRADDPEGYERILGCLSPPNQAWVKAAPAVALSVAKSTFTRNDKPNRVAIHDLGAASATLTFEATARGLVVHQMAGLDVDRAKEVCGVPDGFQVVAAMAIGYVAEPQDVPEDLHSRDAKSRRRNPLGEFVFSTEWGKAVEL